MTLHLVGFALVAEAGGLLLSGGVAVVDGGRDAVALASTGVVALVVGLVLWRGTARPRSATRRQAFAAVTWTWLAVCAVGAAPFVLTGTLSRPDDAMFEAVSGFTATGSTILAPIEGVSNGLLFWRSFTQWFGGMGMVVLAVAALPFLGIGGQQLISAEGPGPMSDQMAPRIRTAAARLWIIYVAITAVAALALVAAGTDLYDGVTHAFTAVSTGGFSRYDTSVAHFDSIPVELILDAAMLLGATNFTLHWMAVHGRPGVYLRSSEFRAFVGIVAGATAVVTLLNVAADAPLGHALRDSSFNVVSVVTTTGFGFGDFELWVPAAQLVLLALMVSGSMSGSTSGALKIFRVQVVWRYAVRELHRIRHPRGVVSVRHDGQRVPEPVLNGVMGFVMLYVVTIAVGTLLVALAGSDLVTAAGGAITAIAGVGPGLGDAGPAENFLAFDHPSRAVLGTLMLVGRLEIYPVLLCAAGGFMRVRDTVNSGPLS